MIARFDTMYPGHPVSCSLELAEEMVQLLDLEEASKKLESHHRDIELSWTSSWRPAAKRLSMISFKA
jgi:hypothetical protein